MFSFYRVKSPVFSEHTEWVNGSLWAQNKTSEKTRLSSWEVEKLRASEVSLRLKQQANFVCPLKFLNVWNMKRAVSILGYEWKGGKVWESGAHHWFLPAISKSLFHPAFMCLRGRIGLESVQIPAFPQPAIPPWCAWNKQLFYRYFQEVQIPYYHMANAHGAAKQGSIFQEKRQFRCSANASQPFSRSVSQSVNQFGKERQGPRVGTPLHITSYDVWCFDMQNLNQAPTLRDGSK